MAVDEFPGRPLRAAPASPLRGDGPHLLAFTAGSRTMLLQKLCVFGNPGPAGAGSRPPFAFRVEKLRLAVAQAWDVSRSPMALRVHSDLSPLL